MCGLISAALAFVIVTLCFIPFACVHLLMGLIALSAGFQAFKKRGDDE